MTPLIHRMHGTRLIRAVDPRTGPGWWHYERVSEHSGSYFLTECSWPPVHKTSEPVREVPYSTVTSNQLCDTCVAKMRAEDDST